MNGERKKYEFKEEIEEVTRFFNELETLIKNGEKIPVRMLEPSLVVVPLLRHSKILGKLTRWLVILTIILTIFTIILAALTGWNIYLANPA
jgi:hypothetical protein